MPTEIKTIKLPLPLRSGSVNCYLLKTESGYFLIDTGCPKNHAELERGLLADGCGAGRLKLIILTHGDFDHSGNAAYLREKFGAKIAMHPEDAGVVERGDIFWGRRSFNFFWRKLWGMLSPVFFRFGRAKRFKPDVYVEDGADLAEYGLEARVLHIPGHSRGSIAVLTAGGELFCGDLVVKNNRLVPNSLIDDPAAADASIAKMKSLEIKTVYPGHGRPFPVELMVGGGINSSPLDLPRILK
jgi:glyoxylase-like metal-dependent hydrolase (beta-lactamase superfamily II)